MNQLEGWGVSEFGLNIAQEQYLKERGMLICDGCDNLIPGRYHKCDTSCSVGEYIEKMKPDECHKIVKRINEHNRECSGCEKIVIDLEIDRSEKEIFIYCTDEDCNNYKDEMIAYFESINDYPEKN